MKQLISLMVALFFLFGVLVYSGCQKGVPAGNLSVAPVESEGTLSADNFANQSVPLTLQHLEERGMKIDRNANDGSVKAIDLSDLVLDVDATKEIFDPLVFQALSTTRVVRGKGIFSPALLALCSGMPRLTELLWTETEMKAAPFSELIPLGELKKVRLSGLQTDSMIDVLKTVAALPALNDLDLSGSAVTDTDLTAVIQSGLFGKLTRLNLYHTAVGNAGVIALLPLTDQLVWLNLDATTLTDDAGSTLEKFSQLTFLHLGRTSITNRIVDHLGKLKGLKTLHVTRTNLDTQGFESLKQLLPDTEIVTISIF